jgi:osmotically-inducible protein OsmY
MSSYDRGQFAAISVLWQNDDRKEIRDTIQQAFADDPEISDATNISVVFGGQERKELHIFGSVPDEKSRSRAEEIATRNTAEDVTVVNELAVD